MAKRTKRLTRVQRIAAGKGSDKSQGTSKYAQKVRSGNQMYGPDCCAHSVVINRHQ
jgi:hypothetical protein